jgi:hypothetical protein
MSFRRQEEGKGEGERGTYRVVSFVRMYVAGEVNIDTILVEQLLHSCLEIGIDGLSLIHWTMALDKDPWSGCTIFICLN